MGFNLAYKQHCKALLGAIKRWYRRPGEYRAGGVIQAQET